MKPTLLLLAAGMGSRYGGLKQLDGLGPNGETIMDYSIYDAIQAGFGKIVWVIRKDFEQDFRDKILSKYEGKIPCELVFQSLDKLPEGYTVPEGRTKPWGTNHAVMMAKDAIHEPFCVINCDDFYNRDCFQVIGKFLANLPENSNGKYAMVGFRVSNTLSDNGTVSRGVCSKDENEHLTSCVERTEIERKEDGKVAQMGIFIPGRLGMDEGENVLSMVISGDYSGFMLFFFASGKCAKIPLSSYATKQNRRKLLKAYCDKEPLATMFFLPEETELAIRTSAGRMLLVGTAQITAKTTRDSQGVAVVTLKKNQTIASVVPADTLELANPHRYRVRSLPATGALVRAEDEGEQMTML